MILASMTPDERVESFAEEKLALNSPTEVYSQTAGGPENLLQNATTPKYLATETHAVETPSDASKRLLSGERSRFLSRISGQDREARSERSLSSKKKIHSDKQV